MVTFFIYDLDYLDKDTVCVGRIIDNDPYSGIRVLQENDRKDKKTARKCLRDMYDNRYDVKKILKIVVK